MMHRVTVVLMIAALVLASTAAFAQMEDYSAFRAKVGLFDLAEADTELGFGVDYETYNWMASLDLVELNDVIDLWGLSGTYLFRQDDNPGTYYGGGIGFYNADAGILGDDSSIGFHVLGGMSFGDADVDQLPPWFAEFSYVLGTDFSWNAGSTTIGGDLDGWMLFVGRRF